MKLALILPNLPPARCGVYDYSMKLHELWPKSPEWVLISSCHGAGWPGSSVLKVKREGESLCRALAELKPDAVMLQYTCYGYAENGVPRWLADGLEHFKKQCPARLAVMFHELWYTGPLWTRARWRKSSQHAVARRLCATADVTLTGVPLYQSELLRLSKRPVLLSPIPSNIDTAAFAAHTGPFRVGVFGLPASRERTLKRFASVGGALADELLLMGAGLESHLSAKEKKLVASYAPARVLVEQNIDARSISLALASCHALLIPYASEELPKSGVAMAALAHGCAVIAHGPEIPGGPPFLNALTELGKAGVGATQLRTRAAETGARGRAWYDANNGWPRAVDAWCRALGIRA